MVQINDSVEEEKAIQENILIIAKIMVLITHSHKSGNMCIHTLIS